MSFTLSNNLAADSAATALRNDVVTGLRRTPKTLPPKWFYDAVGSDLFDQITRLPEYYPTRAEAQILREQSAAIAAHSGADTLVELGSGTSEKTRMLLSALRDHGTLRRFVPFDVDAGVLESAGESLQQEYPDLEIDAVCGDFEEHLAKIPGGGRRLFVFLGSTIGNLTPAPRAEFLAALADVLEPGDALLLGTDLVKDADRLVRAYDDSAGVTARFNRNVLAVINRELGADFDLERVQPRRPLERRRGTHRDVVARRYPATRSHPRAGSARRVRRRRGDAHRGVLQVPARRRRRRTRRRRPATDPLVDRPRRRLRPVPGRQVSALAQRWREARLPVAGLHLDSAACSRQSLAAIEAAAAHARHESEVGGYVAAEAAGPGAAGRSRRRGRADRNVARGRGFHHRVG